MAGQQRMGECQHLAGCPLRLLLCPGPQTTGGDAQSGWVFPPHIILSGKAVQTTQKRASPTSQVILNPVKLTTKIKYDRDGLPAMGGG